MKINRYLAAFIIVFLLGAGLRAFYFSKQWSVWWDETVYMAMADAFAGNNYFFEAFRPPLVPASLFLWESLFGYSLLSSRILVLLVSIASLPVAYALTKKAAGDKIALLAAALLAVDAFSVLYSARVLSESFAVLFGTTAITSFYIGYRKKSTSWLALAGVAIALAMMSKHLMAYLGAAILIFFLSKRGLKTFSDRRFYIVLLSGFAVISPWFVVNYAQFGNPFYPQFVNVGLSPPEGLIFYAKQLPVFLGLQGLLLPLAFIGMKKSKHREFLMLNIVAVIVALLVLHTVAHKEDRFLMVITYSLVLFEAVGLCNMANIFRRHAGRIAAAVIAALFVFNFAFVAALPRQYEDLFYKCADEIKKLPNETMSTTMSPYFSYLLKRNFIQLPWEEKDFSCQNLAEVNYTIYYSSGWYESREAAFLNQTNSCTTLLTNITHNQKCLVFKVDE